jgi:hypothetical protein
MFSGHAPVPFEMVSIPLLGGASSDGRRPRLVEALGALPSAPMSRVTARSVGAARGGVVKGPSSDGLGSVRSKEISTSDSMGSAERLDLGAEAMLTTSSALACSMTAQVSQRASPTCPERNASLGLAGPAMSGQYATRRFQCRSAIADVGSSRREPRRRQRPSGCRESRS